MSCQELVEVVTDYLEDELSARDRRRLERHLAECGYCNAYVDQMRMTAHALGRLDRDRLDPALREALLSEFRAWRVSQGSTGLADA